MPIDWTSIFRNNWVRAIFSRTTIPFFKQRGKNPAKLHHIYTIYESRVVFYRAKLFNCEAHSNGWGKRRLSNLSEWVFLESFPFLVLSPRVDPFAAILLWRKNWIHIAMVYSRTWTCVRACRAYMTKFGGETNCPFPLFPFFIRFSSLFSFTIRFYSLLKITAATIAIGTFCERYKSTKVTINLQNLNNPTEITNMQNFRNLFSFSALLSYKMKIIAIIYVDLNK